MVATSTLLVLAALLAALAGFVYVISLSEDVTFTKSGMRIIIGLIVTVVWVLSIAAEILIPAYTTAMIIHGIMGGVVGYLFKEGSLGISIGGDSSAKEDTDE